MHHEIKLGADTGEGVDVERKMTTPEPISG
jgi:hypothetical protein